MPDWKVRGSKIKGAWSRAIFAVARFMLAAAICPVAAHAADDADHGKQLAQIPDFDAARIAIFLRDPHPKMPDMQIATPETADFVAYIVSLK